MKTALLGLAFLVAGMASAPAEIVISGFGTAEVNPLNVADDLMGSWNGAGTLSVDALGLANVSNVASTANGIYSDLTVDGRAPIVIGAIPSELTLTGTLISVPPGIGKFSISLYDTSGSFNELDYIFDWSSFAAGGANGAVVVGTLTGSSGVFNGTVGSWSLNLFDATGVAAPSAVSTNFSDLGVVSPSPQITGARDVQATVGQSFSYQITATNSPSAYAATGLPVGLSIDATSGLVTGTPTLGGVYGVGLSASNADGTSTVTLTMTVNSVVDSSYPTIYSATTASATVGQAFGYQITATNGPAGFGATGLPEGLVIDTTSGLISGTPTQAGAFNVNLSATNIGGTGTATLALAVGSAGAGPVAAPIITSAASAAAQVGVAFSYRITASNAPVVFAASGVPDGLTLDPATGILSGTPMAAGTFTLTLAAANAGGTGTATLTLTVAPAAVVPVQVPTVSVAVAGDGRAVEGGEKGKVVFQRTGDTSAALTVRYKVAGAAKAGVDYKAVTGTVTIPAGAAQATIKIRPIDNESVDGTRIAKVKLLPSLDGSYALGAVTVVKIKIIDND